MLLVEKEVNEYNREESTKLEFELAEAHFIFRLQPNQAQTSQNGLIQIDQITHMARISFLIKTMRVSNYSLLDKS